MGVPEHRGVGVGIVVPTRNSERTLESCLHSLRQQTQRVVIVVVDNHSTDGTPDIAKALADAVVTQGPERSAQRNAGARLIDSPVIGFIDSDMTLDPHVVEQSVQILAEGHGAVIVPETSVGAGYWASVRSLERSFYHGRDDIEAARFFRRDIFEAVGGFDEDLYAAEDWDLTLRTRRIASVGRTPARIVHDEGQLGYIQACRKKAYYAPGLRDFRAKHGPGVLGKSLRRPYFARPWLLIKRDPVLGPGVLALKAGEAVAVALELLVRSRT